MFSLVLHLPQLLNMIVHRLRVKVHQVQECGLLSTHHFIIYDIKTTRLR